ncbi:hypothetical protein CEXT_568131 [Caerostris extrusa]|uniref:Uncharacterized protein n=1 Tax=Caerostris extrusa TaxID=172846 RepID=A0AAV4VRG9_CAEEX|nr:hypothetical protein CEXT_568131 [Caerostris extrusa]
MVIRKTETTSYPTIIPPVPLNKGERETLPFFPCPPSVREPANKGALPDNKGRAASFVVANLQRGGKGPLNIRRARQLVQTAALMR